MYLDQHHDSNKCLNVHKNSPNILTFICLINRIIRFTKMFPSNHHEIVHDLTALLFFMQIFYLHL